MTYYKKKYGYKDGDYPQAEKIGASTISIPFYPKLKPREVAYVIKVVNELTSAKA
jgi:dTDP-4-amino-4,6-dideoxygalactose transaminase